MPEIAFSTHWGKLVDPWHEDIAKVAWRAAAMKGLPLTCHDLA